MVHAMGHVTPADDAGALHESSLLEPVMMRHALWTGTPEQNMRRHVLPISRFLLARLQAPAEAESQGE
jgi:hypothetical protein